MKKHAGRGTSSKQKTTSKRLKKISLQPVPAPAKSDGPEQKTLKRERKPKAAAPMGTYERYKNAVPGEVVEVETLPDGKYREITAASYLSLPKGTIYLSITAKPNIEFMNTKFEDSNVDNPDAKDEIVYIFGPYQKAKTQPAVDLEDPKEVSSIPKEVSLT